MLCSFAVILCIEKSGNRIRHTFAAFIHNSLIFLTVGRSNIPYSENISTIGCTSIVLPSMSFCMYKLSRSCKCSKKDDNSSSSVILQYRLYFNEALQICNGNMLYSKNACVIIFPIIFSCSSCSVAFGIHSETSVHTTFQKIMHIHL